MTPLRLSKRLIFILLVHRSVSLAKTSKARVHGLLVRSLSADMSVGSIYCFDIKASLLFAFLVYTCVCTPQPDLSVEEKKSIAEVVRYQYRLFLFLGLPL